MKRCGVKILTRRIENPKSACLQLVAGLSRIMREEELGQSEARDQMNSSAQRSTSEDTRADARTPQKHAFSSILQSMALALVRRAAAPPAIRVRPRFTFDGAAWGKGVDGRCEGIREVAGG
eukprot:3234788-Pleurochrysis_carterae.AAC.1